MSDWQPILSGIVGSTAYGLAGPDSDVDRLSFAAAPTVAFHGLRPPTGKAASRVSTSPDLTVHEVGKALSLLLTCNPTVTELLWLPDALYETRTELGDELIDLRRALLSAPRVRSAYLGYATQQFVRLRNRTDGTFSSNTAKRTAKHGRHLLRLVTACQHLYLTGTMSVQVDDPQRYHDFGQIIADNPEKGLPVAEHLIATTEMALDSKPSVLPQQPDERAAEDWLIRVRRHYYIEESA